MNPLLWRFPVLICPTLSPHTVWAPGAEWSVSKPVLSYLLLRWCVRYGWCMNSSGLFAFLLDFLPLGFLSLGFLVHLPFLLRWTQLTNLPLTYLRTSF